MTPHVSRLFLPVVAMLTASATLGAQAPLRPAPSGRATSEVTLTAPPAPGAAAAAADAKPLAIRLDYGQPHLRGRTLHTDSLVPYDKPWRTGANGPTTLTSDVDLVIGGTGVAKGVYVVYTIPGASGWKLILQRSVGQSDYSESNDVARIDLRQTKLSAPLESLTMWLIPSLEPGPARGELRFAWGTDQLSVGWSVK